MTVLYDFDNDNFIGMMYEDGNGDLLTHFYFLGTQDAAKCYGYEITIKTDSYRETYLYSSTEVESIDTSSLKILEESKGFIIPQKVVQKCLRGSSMNFRIKFIRNFDHFDNYDNTSTSSGYSSPRFKRNHRTRKEDERKSSEGDRKSSRDQYELKSSEDDRKSSRSQYERKSSRYLRRRHRSSEEEPDCGNPNCSIHNIRRTF